ncbi:hypothetical protein F511_23502 [Dorcoceras hygrometricum]|uniref:Uncharacterized protein n=1 Tax=Dorcoceras hygrometricum TaxID=472368 RepID=A0A2Z7A7G6_9LAMI|nr:hypothetical protein F511_23502 [Dorcoceras hygrometricum]
MTRPRENLILAQAYSNLNHTSLKTKLRRRVSTYNSWRPELKSQKVGKCEELLISTNFAFLLRPTTDSKNGREMTGLQRGVQWYQPCSKLSRLSPDIGEDKVRVNGVEGFAMGISARALKEYKYLSFYQIDTLQSAYATATAQHQQISTGLSDQLSAFQSTRAKSARYSIQLRHQINSHYTNQHALLNSTVLPDQLSSHQISTARSAYNSIGLMQLDPIRHCSIRSTRFNKSAQSSSN